jgi:antitoxin (DNA-binding transcriptional repressor) of toxin-antitoxin stability system
MQTFKEVRNGLRTAYGNATREGNERKKKAVRAVVKHLLEVTPVDTTKAMSNWLVGIGEPQKVELEARVEGEAGSSKAASAAATYAETDRLIRTVKAGQTVYITNNTPYIGRLNAGSSSQAPAGFIEGAGLIGREVLKEPSGWSKRG